MMHYLLFYEGGADYEIQRTPYRAAHLQYAREAAERGVLILGGAYAEPVDGALLVFRGDSPVVAEEFARRDPYVVNGVVKRWFVRRWTPIVGTNAES